MLDSNTLSNSYFTATIDISIYHSLVAQAKNLQPAVVFLPLRLQDQNSLPVLGPGLYTCRRRVRRPHPHSGGVPSAWHEPGEAASSCGLL